MAIRIWRLLTWIALPVLLIAGCGAYLGSALGVRVEIGNVGATTLHDVAIIVTGNRYAVGDLAPGASVRERVVARGESHIEVSWKSPNETAHHTSVDCYFEGNSLYAGDVVVELDGGTVVRTKNDTHLWP